jgi:hypothetical protein
MYAHIQGQTFLMSELDKFRMILAESDYILHLSECYQYEVHNDVLVKKENDIPTLYDAIHASMTLDEYVKRYPERHNYNNRLDQFTPSFRRTSST